MAGELSRWLAQARDLLREAAGTVAEPVTVTVQDAKGVQIVWTLPGDAVGVAVSAALSPIEKDILRVIGTATLPAKAIAHRLGRPYGTFIKTILANLRDREPPIIEATGQGYRCARPARTDE